VKWKKRRREHEKKKKSGSCYEMLSRNGSRGPPFLQQYCTFQPKKSRPSHLSLSFLSPPFFLPSESSLSPSPRRKTTGSGGAVKAYNILLPYVRGNYVTPFLEFLRNLQLFLPIPLCLSSYFRDRNNFDTNQFQ
jgi:hypothetical protein